MIAYITGTIFDINISKDSYVDILTNGGVGYRVCIPSNYITPEIGQPYSLYTYFHVKEDSQTLYGFNSEEEKNFFKEIISVSGVGPKIGLAILSNFSKEDLAQLIEDGDAKKLGKVPGLGIKRAQKIILELKGKIDFNIQTTQNQENELLKELKDALKALGYKGDALEEKTVYAQTLLEKNSDIDIETLIKKALQQ